MDKFFNWLSIIGGAVGGFLAWLFGGWDTLIIALVVLVGLDYISGLIKAAATKELSSEIGFRGIGKKVCIFLIVAAAGIAQAFLGDILPLRETVITFFAINELLSLLENAAQMGLGIPDSWKNALLQVRDKEEKE